MRVNLGILYAAFSLMGCTSLSGNYSENIEEYQYTQAYNLDTFLKKTRCSHWLGGYVEFKAPDKNLADYVIGYKLRGSEEYCLREARTFMLAQCKNWTLGANQYKDRKFCQDENENVLYSWESGYDYFYLNEPLKGREKEWVVFASEKLGYETSNEKMAREKKELEERLRKENDLSVRFSHLVKGEPDKIKKAPIGTRICKLAGNARKTILFYSNRPDSWEKYIGGIEKVVGDKVLVRYEYHGNKYSYYDDVKGLVRWEDLNGWYVCD